MSLIINAVNEALFMSRSGQLFDSMFDVAHVTKVVSYGFILTGLLIDVGVVLRRDLALGSRVQAILDSTADGIITIDREGIVQSINMAVKRIFGYEPDEVVGQNIKLLMPSPYHEDHRTGEVRILNIEREVEGRRKDGTSFPLAIRVRKMDEDDAYIGTVQDITDRKKAQEELRFRERQYRDLVETSNDLIWAVDVDGRWTFLSRDATQRIYGYEVEEMLGRPFAEVLAPDKLEDATAIFGRALKGEAIERYPTVHLHKDGSRIELRFNALMVHDEEGNLTGMTGTATDVTNQSKLEAQLLQSQKMEAVGRLAGGVAHDFNNLLTVIVGECQMASRKLTADDSPVRRSFSEIEAATDRAAALTRQLLTFSRQQVVDPEVFSPAESVRHMGDMLRRLIGERVDLVTDVTPDTGLVRADRAQIGQVIMNLGVNARDAMPDGGRLSIATRNVTLDGEYVASRSGVLPGEYVLLTVSDSGTGMSEETIARAFDPFFTTKGEGEGTGLGLATSHGIVEQSGGHIGVYSEVGRGTVMKVYLPRVEPVADRAARPATEDVPTGTETVLLAEDEDRLRNLVRRMLEELGYTVLVAPDGNQALEILKGHSGPLHLLLTDVVMPRMGGPELADRVNELRPDLKVLYMSGYTDDHVLSERVLTEQVEFLQKPFTLLAVATKVRKVLDEE